jgi:eukaryotic-like serine/threonine-protein kinase
MQTHGKVNAGRTSHSVPADSLPDDLFGLSVDPILVELADEYSRRTMAGETVDVDGLISAHPGLADAFKKLLPLMQGLAEFLPVDGGSNGPTAEADAHTAAAGKVFGEFQIVREIGRGGMGVVYEARQFNIGRRVALKVLPLAAAMDPKALQRFQLEAQVAALLQHPHIVPVHAVGTVDQVPYFAMQLIEGGSLAALISELRGLVDRGADHVVSASSGDSPSALALGLLTGRFAPSGPESDSDRHHVESATPAYNSALTAPQSIRGRTFHRTVARLGIQTAQALGYAHDQGVVHRDVKPANLLLDRRGDLWVADFGMADVQGDSGLTMTGELPGTLRYMSPEQAAGKRALIDRRTDIYSLGATLYELLTLQPAIVGSDRAEIIRRIAEEEPEPARRLNPALPVDLATIVTKALSKDPAKRYDSARHIADDLERFLDGRPIAARPVGPLARAWRWCKRKPMQAGLAAGLVLALVVGFTGITWNWWKAQAAEHLALTQAAKARAAEEDALVQAATARTESAKAAAAEKDARAQSAKVDAINTFLIEKLLGQASPMNNPDATRVTLRSALDRAVADLSASFRDQPDIEAALEVAMGQTYHDLGDHTKSEALYRKAFEIRKNQPGAPGKERILAMCKLGHALYHLQRRADAEPLIVEAVELARTALGPDDPATLSAIGYLAELWQNTGRTDEAEALFRQLINDYTRVRGATHTATLAAINNLGTLLRSAGKREEAERLFREALKIQRDANGPEHPYTLTMTANLASMLTRNQRFDEAEMLYRQALEVQRRVLGPDHAETLETVVSLAGVLHSQSRLDEAEDLLQSCLEAQRRTLGADHAATLRTAAALDAIRNDRSQSKDEPRQ